MTRLEKIILAQSIKKTKNSTLTSVHLIIMKILFITKFDNSIGRYVAGLKFNTGMQA